MKKLLLQFTFDGVDQDYSLCEEQYEADIDEEAGDKVRGQLRWIFDEKQASEVLNQYLK